MPKTELETAPPWTLPYKPPRRDVTAMCWTTAHARATRRFMRRHPIVSLSSIAGRTGANATMELHQAGGG